MKGAESRGWWVRGGRGACRKRAKYDEYISRLPSDHMMRVRCGEGRRGAARCGEGPRGAARGGEGRREARGGEVRRAHLEIGDGGAQRGRPVDHVLA